MKTSPELTKIQDKPGSKDIYKITVPGTRAKIFANIEELRELYKQIEKEI